MGPAAGPALARSMEPRNKGAEAQRDDCSHLLLKEVSWALLLLRDTQQEGTLVHSPALPLGALRAVACWKLHLLAYKSGRIISTSRCWHED